MSKSVEPSDAPRPPEQPPVADAWDRLADVELRGLWFHDEATGDTVECRGFVGRHVRFRGRDGERVELPREVARDSMRLIRGPTDTRPPSAEQLPERLSSGAGHNG